MNEQTSKPLEEARRTVVSLEEIGPESFGDLAAVGDILVDPVNSIHFSGEQSTFAELQDKARRPDYHLLAARNQLGEIVGTLSVVDRTWDINTHLIEKVAVKSKLHGQGVGGQMFERAIVWAFETPTYQDRERKILFLWVEEDIPGWEGMKRLITSLGFKKMLRVPDMVVKMIDGREVEKPASMYFLQRA